MKKQVALLLLAASIALTSFTGCNHKKPVDPSSSGVSSFSDDILSSVGSGISSFVSGSETSSAAASSSIGSAASSQPQQGGSSFKAPIYDLKGRTIKIMMRQDFETSSSFDLFMSGFEEAEEKFNCNITITKYSDTISEYKKLTTNHSSKKADYDIFMMWGFNVTPRYAASGVILNLSKYYDYKSDPAWQNEYVKNVGVWKGDRYGLTYGDTTPGYCIWYNKKLFAQANVPDPWTYVESNNWNWKTFRDVCRKLTRNTDNVPGPDVWAFNAGDSLSSFIVTNGGSLIDTSSGSGKFAADSPQAQEAIEFNRMLFAEDKVIPTSTSGLNKDEFLQMQSGKLAMFPYTLAYGDYLVKNGMKASDLGWVYWPKGNATINQDYIIPNRSEPNCWVIPADVSEPEKVVALATYATAFWSSARKKPVDILKQNDKVFENDDYLDILVGNTKKLFMEGSKKNVYTKYLNYEGAQPKMVEMFDEILTGKSTVGTSLAKYKSAIQTLITQDESPGSLG